MLVSGRPEIQTQVRGTNKFYVSQPNKGRQHLEDGSVVHPGGASPAPPFPIQRMNEGSLGEKRKWEGARACSKGGRTTRRDSRQPDPRPELPQPVRPDEAQPHGGPGTPVTNSGLGAGLSEQKATLSSERVKTETRGGDERAMGRGPRGPGSEEAARPPTGPAALLRPPQAGPGQDGPCRGTWRVGVVISSPGLAPHLAALLGASVRPREPRGCSGAGSAAGRRWARVRWLLAAGAESVGERGAQPRAVGPEPRGCPPAATPALQAPLPMASWGPGRGRRGTRAGPGAWPGAGPRAWPGRAGPERSGILKSRTHLNKRAPKWQLTRTISLTPQTSGFLMLNRHRNNNN